MIRLKREHCEYTIPLYTWLGCDEPKYRYDLESVGLMCKSVNKLPSISIQKQISRKGTHIPSSSNANSSISKQDGFKARFTELIQDLNCLCEPVKNQHHHLCNASHVLHVSLNYDYYTQIFSLYKIR